jgi:hypothetical protein
MQLSGFYIQPESTQNTQDPKSDSVPDLDSRSTIRSGPDSNSFQVHGFV